MKTISNKLVTFFILTLFIVILSACDTIKYTILVESNRISPVYPSKKYPYNVAFLVDMEMLNKMHSQIRAGIELSMPVGRSLPVYYKELLDLYFEDVNMVLKEETDSLVKYDLITRISFDECDFKLEELAKLKVKLKMTLLFATPNGQELFSRTFNNKRMAFLSQDKSEDDFKIHLEKEIGKAVYHTINEILDEFVLRLERSAELTKFQFKSIKGFLRKLCDKEFPAHAHILSKLPDDLQKQLIHLVKSDKLYAYRPNRNKPAVKAMHATWKKEVPEELQNIIAKELNDVLRDKKFYDETVFKNITLSDNTLYFLDKKVDSKNRLPINRSILDDLFSDKIERYDIEVSDTLSSLRLNSD